MSVAAQTSQAGRMTDEADLDSGLMAAFDAGDGAALIALYGAAGDLHAARGDVDAACFFWTQAYVFALDLGDARARHLRTALIAQGREE